MGVRRAVATRVATQEPEDSQSHKRWALGVAVGALLVAGTFAAGALGITGGAANTAGSAPDHAPASPGHHPGSGPVVAGAPAPGQENTQQQPQDQQPQETAPASAGPRAGVPVAADTSADLGTGSVAGDGQLTVPTTSTPATPAPAPAPASAEEQQQDSGGGLVDTAGDVLTPVTDVVGDILSPSSFTVTTTSTTAPAGPALTMIDPLGDLVGN